VIVRFGAARFFGNLSLGLKVSTFTTPSKVIMSCNLCITVNVYVFLFTYYKLCGMHERLRKMNFFVNMVIIK
jgi:hypothetical protein